MWKDVRAVLLPTNKEASYNDIVTTPRYPNMIQLFGTFENSYSNECKVQQLYIISLDEEINKAIVEGDWYINGNYLYQADRHYKKANNDKKILATTNLSLTIPTYIEQNSGKREYLGNIHYLPKIPQQFIEEWIEEYNKKNVIENVEVEYDLEPTLYEDKKWGDKRNKHDERNFYMKEVLKLSEGNYLFLRRKEQRSYTREQREELLNLIQNVINYGVDVNGNLSDKWIQQNL